MNPTAPTLWAFLACGGFLISGTTTGAVSGLMLGLGLSLLASSFRSKHDTTLNSR